MGCNASRLDDDKEMPAGLRPFRGQIKETKRRRVRNVSIVSTTELLRPEDREVVDDECEKKDKCMKNVIIKKEEVFDGELPRSPSFRVYFIEAAEARDSDDDSVKAIQKIKEDLAWHGVEMVKIFFKFRSLVRISPRGTFYTACGDVDTQPWLELH